MQSATADATLVMARTTLDEISLQRLTFPEAFQAGSIKVEGKFAVVATLMQMIDRFDRMFAVMTPMPPLLSPPLPNPHLP